MTDTYKNQGIYIGLGSKTGSVFYIKDLSLKILNDDINKISISKRGLLYNIKDIIETQNQSNVTMNNSKILQTNEIIEI